MEAVVGDVFRMGGKVRVIEVHQHRAVTQDDRVHHGIPLLRHRVNLRRTCASNTRAAARAVFLREIRQQAHIGRSATKTLACVCVCNCVSSVLRSAAYCVSGVHWRKSLPTSQTVMSVGWKAMACGNSCCTASCSRMPLTPTFNAAEPLGRRAMMRGT